MAWTGIARREHIEGSFRRDILGLLLAHYASPHTKFLTVPRKLGAVLRARKVGQSCAYETCARLGVDRRVNC